MAIPLGPADTSDLRSDANHQGIAAPVQLAMTVLLLCKEVEHEHEKITAPGGIDSEHSSQWL